MKIQRLALSLVVAALAVRGVALAQSPSPAGSAPKAPAKAPSVTTTPGPVVTGPDTGTLPVVKPSAERALSVERTVKNAPLLPGKDGAPPRPKPGVARTTGDEDEMDDLDVQRRTAPSDLGDKPLPALNAPLAGEAGSAVVGSKPPAVVAKPKAGGQVARTTGDEDEMDDLDVQRRTAPGDLGDKPLPSPDAPLAVSGKARPAGLPAIPAVGQLRLAKPVFRADELIAVSFAGMPGNKHDWITIVPVGTPDNQYGEWAYLSGQSSGTHRFGRLLKPGRYEVRLYHDWPAGNFNVKARVTVDVQ